MRTTLVLFVRGSGAAAVLVVGVAPTGAQQRPTALATLVFDGVTVVDVQTGKLVPAQRVVIASNRIRAMGRVGAVKLPKGPGSWTRAASI